MTEFDHRPRIYFQADLDFNGTWETDLTPYANSVGGGWSIDRSTDEFGQPQISTFVLALDNQDARFTPENTASPLYGKLVRDVPIRIVAYFDEGTAIEESWTRWTGYVQTWAPDITARTCTVHARDILGVMGGATGQASINVAVSETRDVTDMANAVMDAAGWSAGVRDFDDCVQTLLFSYALQNPPDQAFMEAAAAELGGHVSVNGAGQLRLEARNRRLGVSRWLQVAKKLAPSWWGYLSEPRGTVVNDYGTAANNGTYVGSPTLAVAGGVTGDYLRAFTAAAGKYVTAPDHALLDPGDTFTLSVLFKPRVGSVDHILLDKGTDGYLLFIDSTNKIRFQKHDSTLIFQTTATVTIGAWNLITVTKAGSTVKCWLNGVDVTPTVTNATIVATATALHIGRYTSGGFDCDGDLMQAMVFGRALTAAECADLYHAFIGDRWIWGDDSTVRPLVARPIYDDTDYLTKVRVRTTVFRKGQEGDRVWSLFGTFRRANAAYIDPGPPITTEEFAGSPTLNLITPVAVQDYRGAANIDGTGGVVTANLSMTIVDLGAGRFRRTMQVIAGGARIYYEAQVRGQTVSFAADRSEAVFEDTIPARPPGREFAADIPFSGDLGQKGRDYAYQLLRTYRPPVRRMQHRYAWASRTIAKAMLDSEIGQLVSFRDTDSGVRGSYVKDWFYVTGIRDSGVVGAGGAQAVETEYTLHPSQVYRDLDRLRWDEFDRANATGGLGTSDQGAAWSGSTNYDISTGAARANSATPAVAYISLGALAWDQVVECTLADMAADDRCGVVVRYVDASNYLWAYVSRADSLLHLDRVVAGVRTSVATAAWTSAATAEVRAIIQGERIRVEVDRVLRIDSLDQWIREGAAAGIHTLDASGTARFTRWSGQAF